MEKKNIPPSITEHHKVQVRNKQVKVASGKNFPQATVQIAHRWKVVCDHPSNKPELELDKPSEMAANQNPE
ncbi:hypothetical protein ACFX13_036253 [Malus domestica]